MAKRKGKETTVSLKDGKGKTILGPMPSSEFSKLAESIGKEPVVAVGGPSLGRKFFAGAMQRLVFVKFKPRMDKEGKRYLSLTFSVRLAPTDVLACDQVIQAAYETIESLEKECPRVEIERVYKNFNAEFFALPDSARPSMALRSVSFGAIALERTPDGDAYLHFSTEFPYRTDAGHWAVDNWGMTFWARFRNANRDLFTDSAGAAGAGG